LALTTKIVDMLGDEKSLERQAILANVRSQENGREMMKLFNEANIVSKQLKKNVDVDFKRQREVASATVAFNDALKEIKGAANSITMRILGSEQVTKAISDVGEVINKFFNGKVIGQLSDMIVNTLRDLGTTIADYTKEIAEHAHGLSGWIKEKMGFDEGESVGEFIKRKFSEVSWTTIATVAAGAIGLGVGKGIVGGFIDYLRKDNSSNESSTGGSSGNSVTNALSNPVSTLFGAIGDTILGIIGGFKDVLLMFSNPAILAGAGIFAGSLGVIGAGIAGFVELINISSLPEVQKTIDGFIKLDSTKLEKAGNGLYSLANGLSALSGGSITNSIANFFTGNDFEKTIMSITKLSSESEKINILASSIDNLAESLNKLSTVKGSTINTPAANSYSTVKTGITEATEAVKTTTNKINDGLMKSGSSDRDVLVQINKSMENQIGTLTEAVLLLRRNNDLTNRVLRAIEEK